MPPENCPTPFLEERTGVWFCADRLFLKLRMRKF
jgi:hypothetical protein